MGWPMAAAIIGSTFLSQLMGGGGGGTGTTAGTATAEPMERPAEYDALWDEFMGQYFGESPALQGNMQEKREEIKSAEARYESLVGKLGWKNALKRESAKSRVNTLKDELSTLTSQARAEKGIGFREHLGTAYGEQRGAIEDYLGQLGVMKEPYLETYGEEMGVHRGLLDEIVKGRMAGDAIGPYGADIDKLLGERTGISFGGGDPMQFITGSQQRLLSDLIGGQETGLQNIIGASGQRAQTGIAPAAQRYGMEREIADTRMGAFMPSNVADLAYLQDLRGMIEPMEHTRFHATPSVTTTGTATQPGVTTAGGYLDNLNRLLNIGTGMYDLFGGGGTSAGAGGTDVFGAMPEWYQ